VPDKALISRHSMSFLIGLLSSPTDNLRISAATALYYLFEEKSTHQQFVNGNGANGLVKMVDSNPGAQVWALGAIGRLAQSSSAFKYIETAGLDHYLTMLIASRSALIVSVATILTGSGDVRQKMIEVEAHMRPAIDKAGADI